MLFKGTPTRSPRTSPSRSIRSAGRSTRSPRRNTPATTSRCSTSTCRWRSTSWPTWSAIRCSPTTTSSARRRSSSKRSRWSRTRPTISVHEIFAEGFWSGHPLGRPILGTPASVSALDQPTLRQYLRDTYVAAQLRRRRGRQSRARPRARRCSNARSQTSPHTGRRRGAVRAGRRAVDPGPQEGARAEPRRVRHPALPQHHPERYAGYALNTMLGGSMSSRLFQNVREKRGLAYAVFSGLSAYQDAGALSIYAGCANEAVARADRRRRRRDPADEGRRPRPDRAAPRQGSPEGLADARPRKHVEPDVASRAPGDVPRSAPIGLDEMLAAIEARDRRTTCCGWRIGSSPMGRWRDRARQRQRPASDQGALALKPTRSTPAMIPATPTLRWAASGASSAGTKPGSRWKSRPPKRWPPPASSRPKPRATCETRAPSTSPASTRSKRSPSTT